MPTHNLQRRLRSYLVAERPAIFSLGELRRSFAPHPSVSIEAALKRLLENGDVARVSRGRYTAIDPATGSPVAHPWAQALAPFRTAAVAGYTALQHWLLTTQIPQVIDIAVKKGAHHQPSYGAVERVRIITVPALEWFGITDLWVTDGERISIFSRSRMVFDTFINPTRYGGLGNAMSVLETAREIGMPLDELVDMARQSHSVRAVRRFAQGLDAVFGPDRTIDHLSRWADDGLSRSDSSAEPSR